MQEIEFSHIPINCIQIYSSKFRDMLNGDIQKSINFEREWKPYGYTKIALCRATGTVYISRPNTVQKDEIIWLISAYGFLLCGNGRTLTSGESFARHIRLATNQDESRNREAARIAEDLDTVGRFETDYSGTAVSFIHYIR